MLIARGRLSFPKFNKGKFARTLDDLVRAQVRNAAQEWLRAVIPRVPVFTGTSQGSLMPLGRLVRVAVNPRPRAVRPGLGPSAGAATAPQTPAAYFPAPRGNVYLFKFTTNVAHFIYNNLNVAHDPPFHLINETPWYATRAGNEAFNAYLAEEMPRRVRLLRLKDFITYSSISYGGG